MMYLYICIINMIYTISSICLFQSLDGYSVEHYIRIARMS